MIEDMQEKNIPRVAPTPDVSEALHFLKFLDEEHDQFTFETIEEPKPFQGPTKIRRYIGALSEHKEALLRANLNGNGVFVTVNATDDKGRKKENVKRVRALFVDLDGSSLEPVLQGPLCPHITVESSPRRYHAYWIVEGVPLQRFEGIQKLLAQRFGGDPAVCATYPD